MNELRILALILAASVVWSGPAGSVAYGERVGPPNVVFILADDLGFADLGCTGSDLLKNT